MTTPTLDPEGVTRLLSKVLAGAPKLPGAACREHADVFDPDAGDPHTAMAICRGCPALNRCRSWSAELRGQERPAGVVAGQPPTQRPVGQPPTHHRKEPNA
ncbi:WhiB family transcriptional regulator [Mycobacterium avium]|uniref:WhiB family transcriptional regulator n=2 Tax=Mycobacteriaceae TaxID=1762 RepID=UPI0011574BB4|nr:WhiB family transcriptional regulator [Mycobacterium avium]MCV7100914.1 WhiB family transcriptional regulator [Mycobacterium palustre]MDV3215729.1 WhiB family transcriptional regulator [Mycobacterium avium]